MLPATTQALLDSISVSGSTRPEAVAVTKKNAVSLGYAEINFLKQSSEELADLWVRLEGNPAWCQESKLHLFDKQHKCPTLLVYSESGKRGWQKDYTALTTEEFIISATVFSSY